MDQPHPCPDRRRWMAVLARSSPYDLGTLLDRAGARPSYSRLRGPEVGLVMVRGRAGGGGAAFNLGEMSVTRCTVQTEPGFVGHAYIAGRDNRLAELAALADALLQDPDWSERVEHTVIAPLESLLLQQRDAASSKAGATKVEFFAMQTMRT